MIKTILVIFYTQTGQLKQVLDSLLRPPCGNAGFSIDYLEIKPQTPFPFPWTRREFLDVFPESVMEKPAPLQPIPQTVQRRYDLIILAFQPWYLSPSIPISSFLKTPEAEKIFQGSDVLTVIGARNMWQGAFACVKEKVEGYGGRICGNIALVDRAPNLVSVITIAYWLFTGKKNKFLGLFPPPGVSEADIAAAGRFWEAIGPAVLNNRLDGLDETLRNLGAAEINDALARLENRARKVFTLWANLIIKVPKIRGMLLNLFLAELVFALAVISPINSLLGVIIKSLRRKSGEC
ncbi:MAG: hypothetical protein PHY29_03425 [Syntrophales bacterium]|nr:hypothetical protein [Syntrophales bacterium]